MAEGKKLAPYCKYCGAKLGDRDIFCPSCNKQVRIRRSEAEALRKAQTAQIPVQDTSKPKLHCPKCGSTDVDLQVHQENIGGQTITKTKSKYKEKGHGCMWWLIIGWWWWIVDLFLWIFIFPIRFLLQLFKKKKYVGESTSVASTKNKVEYKSVFLCKSCGHHWEK